MSDALRAASDVLPLYRRSHEEYIVFCERAAKVLLGAVSELDVREFEMSAARLEGTMVELQETVRRLWESTQRIDQGLQTESSATDRNGVARNAALTAQDSAR